jgi:DNA-binding transcriptional regulator YhcF (GntR family)
MMNHEENIYYQIINKIKNDIHNRHSDLREKLLKVRSKSLVTNRSTLSFPYNQQWAQRVFSIASRELHQHQHIH